MAGSIIKYVDHTTFPEVLGELFRNYGDMEGITWSAQFPKTSAQVPSINWKRVRRVPGIDGVESLGPRLRNTEEYPGPELSEIYAQWQDCLFQFNCCARSADEAEELLVRFENFMDQSIPELMHLGAFKVFFQEELQDMLLPRSDDIEVRSIRYRAILNKLTIKSVTKIDQIRVRVLEPQEETYQEVVRSSLQYDILADTYISEILFVSTYSPSGIARTHDYVNEVDFCILYDEYTRQTAIRWLDAGKQPAAGETYYVRYKHWTGFSRLLIPNR